MSLFFQIANAYLVKMSKDGPSQAFQQTSPRNRETPSHLNQVNVILRDPFHNHVGETRA